MVQGESAQGKFRNLSNFRRERSEPGFKGVHKHRSQRIKNAQNSTPERKELPGESYEDVMSTPLCSGDS